MSPTILPDTIHEKDQKSTVKEIPLYKVIFLNDDLTSMDFVVYVLITIFKKDPESAARLMLEIHNTGAAIVDILPLEEAEFRQQQTHSTAHTAGFPLRCIIEPI